MAAEVSTPPVSRTSSSSSPKRRHSPNLSLDFSDLPALTQPTPPSNTLIITNLDDPSIFTAPNLQAIRNAIDTQAPLHSFCPLTSFRRIITSFWTIEAAVAVRSVLDGENVLGHRVRVYFGEPTVLEPTDQHLHLPESQRLFFISPPPSPPHGWEMRNEEPPNKAVHADDLAEALSKLRSTNNPNADIEMSGASAHAGHAKVGQGNRRSRSSTIVFDPVDQGHSPDLPAIAVMDTGADEDEEVSPVDVTLGAKSFGAESKARVHTARPPVELME